MSLAKVIINVIGPEIMLKQKVAISGSSSTVAQLISTLLNQLAGPWEQILDSDGSLKKGCTALVNGRNIQTLDGYSTRLHDGDEVTFTVLISGG